MQSNPVPPERGADPAGGAYRPGYELVAEQILRFIAESELSPGDRMPTEKDLAIRLGASRTVVREAVKILSATGRVSAHRGRGLFVADGTGPLGEAPFGGFFVPTDLDHIFQLFEFRKVQEVAAAELAAVRAGPAELREIEAAAQRCRNGHDLADMAEFEAGDDAFHLGVATASHNSFLVAAVREARRLQRRASVIGIRGIGGHAAEAVEEHEAIHRAIRDGRPELAAAATATHLENTLKDYRREIHRRVFG
ncbi:FadR/GntR family transcriptional regulator [Pseudonocardia sp. CA-107938]|uniref:FadR/GntR family transcriptional regulator n=1 Tax=Pseudonocardia sp. CA-107938 TaxID=3240021 RepID=UPI003D906A5E